MRELEVQEHGPPAAGRDDAEELARRAVARDSAAWSAIFEAHFNAVFTFLRYRLRGADEAEDLAAQVFEVAYARADRFDFRGLPIEAWLIGIARNLARDSIKKRARRGAEEELVEARAPLATDDISRADLRRDLGVAMRALTEDQQTVLSLRFLLDRSVEETARLMGRSEDAVKHLQRRALAAMQRALDATGYRQEAERG